MFFPAQRTLRLSICLAAVAWCASLSQPTAAEDAAAQAPSAIEPGSIKDTSDQPRSQMVSIFTGFEVNRFIAYGFPLTFNARYYLPIVSAGLIPEINDEVGIEGGVDFLILLGDKTYLGFGIPIALTWDFHITDHFDAYGKVGLTIGATPSYRGHGATFSYHGYWIDNGAALGLRLKLGGDVYLRAEAGYPLIMAGVGFAF